jgi:hypothetical protein
MRPGQNKQRMRGRPTNNRRGPNPLTRSYESNGPDVKIRGNAHHVAEKYLQLARDAHTGGDPVAAENYLQHAEHYFRLIAAAQAAQLQAQSGSGRPPGESESDDAEDDDDGGVLDRFASPAERAASPYVTPQPQFAPQPNLGGSGGQFAYGERQPFENDRQSQPDRNGFLPRSDRPMNRNPDRGSRPERPFQDRQDRHEGHRENRGPNDSRQREFRPYREPNGPRDPAPPVEPAAVALPSFITAAPRVVMGQETVEPSEPVAGEIAGGAPGAPEPAASFDETTVDTRLPVRGRRRRTRSPYGFHGDTARDDVPPASSGPDEAPVSE